MFKFKTLTNCPGVSFVMADVMVVIIDSPETNDDISETDQLQAGRRDILELHSVCLVLYPSSFVLQQVNE